MTPVLPQELVGKTIRKVSLDNGDLVLECNDGMVVEFHSFSGASLGPLLGGAPDQISRCTK
jgi:hypothetical protein